MNVLKRTAWSAWERQAKEGVPFIEAHRGSSKFPENTLSAFKHAVEIGADSAELDVWLSKDNELVILHGHSGCLSAKDERMIEQLTLEEIKAVELEGNEKIPTLGEVLDFAKDKLFLNIELKDPKEKETLGKCIELIEKKGMKSQICFSSFNHAYFKVLTEMKLENEFEFGFLLCPDEGDSLVLDSSKNTTNINMNALEEKHVKTLREAKMGVHCWIWKLKSVENEELYQKIFDLRPDVACFDDVEEAQRQLEIWRNKN